MPTARMHARAKTLALALTCFVAAFFLVCQSLGAQQRSATPHLTAKDAAHVAVNGRSANATPLPYRCADSDACDSPEDVAFELARQGELQSSDPDVVRAAAAYGKGVTIEFGDPGPGMESATSHTLRADATAANGLRALEDVIFKEGLADVELAAAVGHEGSHVADAQEFVKAISASGKIDQSKNLSSYQTEFKAYMVTYSILVGEKVRLGFGACAKNVPCHLGFGVDRIHAMQTINELLANPANRCGAAPFYGVSPEHPGPALYELLTPPYLP